MLAGVQVGAGVQVEAGVQVAARDHVGEEVEAGVEAGVHVGGGVHVAAGVDVGEGVEVGLGWWGRWGCSWWWCIMAGPGAGADAGPYEKETGHEQMHCSQTQMCQGPLQDMQSGAFTRYAECRCQLRDTSCKTCTPCVMPPVDCDDSTAQSCESHNTDAAIKVVAASIGVCHVY